MSAVTEITGKQRLLSLHFLCLTFKNRASYI